MPLFLPDFGEEIVAKIFYADNGFDSAFYNDMAWKGLTGPKAFMKLSDTKRKRIIDRIKAEQYKVENNDTVQHGQPAGC